MTEANLILHSITMKVRSISRRTFFKSSATVAALATAHPARLFAAESYGGNKIPFGLQLYSVRNECAKDLVGTVTAVAKMGYKGVEFAGYYGRDAKTLRKLLDDVGLKCCGTHTGLDTLLGDNLAKTIEFNKTLGNSFLIVTEPAGQIHQDASRVAGRCRRLQRNRRQGEAAGHARRLPQSQYRIQRAGGRSGVGHLFQPHEEGSRHSIRHGQRRGRRRRSPGVLEKEAGPRRQRPRQTVLEGQAQRAHRRR